MCENSEKNAQKLPTHVNYAKISLIITIIANYAKNYDENQEKLFIIHDKTLGNFYSSFRSI